ncbi:MAG TPA: family 43 glycosylhydrolase, partial [Iamia sp.]|nr:family 43 glycosylhydrolase [Iamia sp.]
MAARHRRRGLGLLLVLIALGAAVALAVSDSDPEATPGSDAAPATTAPEAVAYANPLVEGLTRNPSILRAADGAYYAYVDGIDLGGPFHVMAYTSPDLATWTMVGDVLDTAGAWADASSGRRFTTPAVRHLPDNPPAARYVMYVTAPSLGGGPSCVAVATAPAPDGPFVGADQPLLCPPGGAGDASPVPGSDQVVYRAAQPDPGVYAVTLTPDGTAVAPGAQPTLVLRTEEGVLRRGVLERPAVARDADGGAYLFVRTGDAADGVGWSPCVMAGSEIATCAGRRQLGSWLAGTAEVGAIGGVQVFADGDGNQWITYHGSPAASCDGATCSGVATMRLDKLCFAHGQPRTTGPSTGSQTTERHADCSADVPGAPLAVTAVNDEVRVGQPPEVTLREGGATVPVGGRLLWLFSDTYLDPAAGGPDGPCRGQGASRSNTAGLGLPHPLAGDPGYASPLANAGPDGQCAAQYLPYTENEAFFTQAQGDVGRRIVLWENGGIPLDDGSALVFFVWGVSDRDADDTGPDPGCGYCRQDLALGVVRVTADQTVADRESTAVA